MNIAFQPHSTKSRNYVKTIKKALFTYNYSLKLNEHLSIENCSTSDVLLFDGVELSLVHQSEVSIETQWFTDIHKWLNAIHKLKLDSNLPIFEKTITLTSLDLQKLKAQHHISDL